ncbi:MAG: hypothetical protein BWK73_34555 [Thiothrix lacustris]|uniref:Uncharacterized protein n=1 Tax=Thiothrix lacustris TaxID=525917 RepID=A0A1Y1QGI7_9GAMM|nr:MAG: hypothetical protein BWK73_34555 [Thiothrix lacustris]
MDNKPERIVIIGVLLLLLLLQPILWQITNDKKPTRQPEKSISGTYLAFIEIIEIARKPENLCPMETLEQQRYLFQKTALIHSCSLRPITIRVR